VQTGRASHARVTASAWQEGAEGCEGGFEPAARARHRKGKHRERRNSALWWADTLRAGARRARASDVEKGGKR